MKFNNKRAYLSMLNEVENKLSHGVLTEKVLLELQMNTSLYDYIEVKDEIIDFEDGIETVVWYDIEGMGYGWRWMRYDENDWHKMMGEFVKMEVESLKPATGEAYFIKYKEDSQTLVYRFIHRESVKRDIVVTLSSKEIDF